MVFLLSRLLHMRVLRFPSLTTHESNPRGKRKEVKAPLLHQGQHPVTHLLVEIAGSTMKEAELLAPSATRKREN